MTPEKQRVAIAKACGVTCDHVTEDEQASYQALLPDYLNDLNAMRAAMNRCIFAQGLKVVDRWIKNLGEDKENGGMELSYEEWHLLNASQLAESMLRTLNLWEE